MTVAGFEAGQRRLNGPQTSGREYRNLSEPEHGLRTDENVPVPMRDGVNLLVDVVRPDGEGRFPALIAASPYPRQIQNSGAPLGFVEAGASDFFAPRGYAHVLANVRGTGEAGGDYDFFGRTESRDMAELVEWAAAQEWCDGNVGMVGISAFAMAQILAAVERPPHLKAIFPVATTVDVWEAAWHNGLLSQTFLTSWMKGVATLASKADSTFRGPVAQFLTRILKSAPVHAQLEHFNGEAALAVMGKVLKGSYPSHPWDQLYLDGHVLHSTKDAWWRERDYAPDLERIEVPVYLGCDWENVPMHLPSTFLAWERLAGKVPLRMTLLGPNGLAWPWESLHVEALAWFDHFLKGRDTGILEGPPVRFQMPGAGDGWRALESWPPPKMRHLELHLRADGGLAAEEGEPGVRSYLHLPMATDRPFTTRLAWATEPLEADLEMLGPLEVLLDAESTALDTGFLFTLQDVGPDGKAQDVTAGWLRASLRAVDEAASAPGRPVLPCDRQQPLTPGERVSCRVPLVPNARRFARGHRIRLVLVSDDQRPDAPAMMGFRHVPVGLPAENRVASSSRLLLPVIGGL